jgi:phosphoadenosine phosphosulfate reductase
MPETPATKPGDQRKRPSADVPIETAAQKVRRGPPDESELAELAVRSEKLEAATPQEIIRWAADEFGESLTMATAFGPEGMVIIHLIHELGKDVSIFNLDTGYQFAETLAMVDRIKQRYGIDVALRKPDLSVDQFEAQHGGPLYKTKPDFCCQQRKLVVLKKAIKGKAAWISAIRRDQSPDRARAAIVSWDKRFELVKVNPLANWTKQDVWKLITDQDVPYNPLHDQGYVSVGCWPCTRAVLFGEDERSGRWSGTEKTECGLHTLQE